MHMNLTVRFMNDGTMYLADSAEVCFSLGFSFTEQK